MPLENFDDIDLPRHPGGRPRSDIDLGAGTSAPRPSRLHQRGNGIALRVHSLDVFQAPAGKPGDSGG